MNNKAYETALHLAEALQFVKDVCERNDCERCMFDTEHNRCNCCLSGEPHQWDINAAMLNIGARIGKEETA